MPIRLRKRIKLFPGVYLNLSKSGISTSLGTRGASVTVGHGKTRTNIGIPGTGISHNSIESNQPEAITPHSPPGMSIFRLLGYGIACLFLLIFLMGLFRGL